MTTLGITFLAESEVDWLQIIVIMLVFGGSVLGSISKKLIEYFGGGKAVTKDKSTTNPQQPRRVAKPRPIQPNRPVARPFPTSPSGRPTARSVAQPHRPSAPPMQPQKAPPVIPAEEVELPELLAEIIGFPKPKTQQPQPKKIRPPAPPKKPATLSKPKQPNLAPKGALRTSKRRPLGSVQPSTLGSLEAESKRSSLRKKSVSKHKTTNVHHIVHLEDVADLEDTLHTSQEAYEVFLKGHAMRPTPMALRKAVILNEILQPPVSLRSDSF